MAKRIRTPERPSKPTFPKKYPAGRKRNKGSCRKGRPFWNKSKEQ